MRSDIQKQKVRFGILKKLIIGFLIPIVFLIILGIISYQKAEDGLVTNYENATNNTIGMATKYIEFAFNSVDAISQGYTGDSELVYFTRGLVHQGQAESLAYTMAMNSSLLNKTNLEPFIKDIHIITKSNVTLMTSDIENMSGFYDEFLESEEGKKFQDTMQETFWGGEHAFIDSKLKLDKEKYDLSFYRKFDWNGACVVIDISQEEITSFLQGLDIGENSIVGLITSDSQEIIVENNTNTKDENEVKETNFGEGFLFHEQEFYSENLNVEDTSSSFYVNYNGSEYLYLYSKIGDTGVTLVGLVPRISIMKQANDIKYITGIIVIIACIVAVSIGFAMSGGINKNIKIINSSIKKIADGDMTVKVLIKSKDEFGLLARNITEMTDSMRGLIHKVSQVSGMVSSSATHVKEVSGEISSNSGNISAVISEINSGISGQASDSQNCLIQMDSLSQKIGIVNDNLEDISKFTGDTKVLIDNGINTIKELGKQSEATNKITKYVVENILALEEKSHSISKIIQVINGIADQTNLLSLNASIEAARAGVYGRGFAVVADEIRKLAEESMNSANEISGVIRQIESQTIDTVATAREAEDIVNMQNGIVDSTMIIFHNMNRGIEDLMRSIHTIENNMHNMDSSRTGTLNAVESISAVAEETLAASDTVENSVQRQEVSVKDLEEASRLLGMKAAELNDVVQKFSIS